MSEPLSVGLAGLGTVGGGLVQLLTTHRERISAVLGRPIEIAGVSALGREEMEPFELDPKLFHDDVLKLATSPSISVFVELIGGSDGIAKTAVEAALGAGKHVVTANKALLAKHGFALAQLAESKGVALNFEAAVAGGIPAIKSVREALAGNRITGVYGILNGTCNYILTKMTDEGLPFDAVLRDAQEMGYAEADPTFDIGGFDAAHKLALLTSLAFGTAVACDEVYVEGIESVTSADIEAAEELGFRIKLLGTAVETSDGIEARVGPAMVPKHSAIAEVSGVTNCVAINADFVGNLMLVGPGAGAKATASAVASDIVDIGRGLVLPPFLRPTSALRPHARATLGAHRGAYYVRLAVHDQPGAMGAIAKRMGDEGVSLESIVQRRPLRSGAAAPVILITHETKEEAIRRALDAIENDGKISERPQMLRIEEL
jgi:homoserine dehydrogenase